ncbi:MAG: sigma-70 family RNA polymerase sigma factor [Candidatus Calescibacterium sp.]|nr:sigma-70 family RNA polymerase sigma factor [Candidatus Calescibacterium sp.]MCX7972232.1 sigma-70 family RNA polymerase sigma factor [bacterium]MDW8195167.1 sigma-70 family RNA polymerase sigma factor [Candidatus Calescibacterium sp.]
MRNKKYKKATLVLYDTYIDTLINNHEEESIKKIIKKYCETENKTEKDKIVCNQLIPKFKKLISKMISKYSTFDKEEITQVAHLAVIKALQNYKDIDQDPTPYFITYIEKEIKSYIMNSDIVRIPKTIRKLYYQIQKYISLNPSYTISELSNKFNLTENAIKEILSIPEKTNIDLSVIKSKEYKDLTLPIEDKIFLEQILNNLNNLERKIIKILFYEDITKTSLANKLNISRKHLYTILNNLKQKLLNKIFS